ncbi:MAG: hypothetical protein OJF51_005038 [Nitrospira sp.]|nr:MAG: hypothetical protein OJF51_005038 [Nitrospira sp.]
MTGTAKTGESACPLAWLLVLGVIGITDQGCVHRVLCAGNEAGFRSAWDHCASAHATAV